MRFKYLLSAVIVFLAFSAFSQNQQISINPAPPVFTEQCGFDHVHQEKLQNDPVYLQRTNEFNQAMASFVAPVKTSSTQYRIPVVVHVMETGNSLTDITDAQIRAAILSLNERYRKVPGSLGDGNGVDVELEFALAVRDPNGNCTDGIVRYDMSGDATYMSSGVYRSSVGISDATLKAYSVWDQTQYYNIWLVSEIDNNNGGSGVQGYAYFASSHGTSSDGAVILASNFESASSTTAAHELGHAFNLYHTFQDDNSGGSCPPNSDCSTEGDLVCDTPPHIRSSSNCPAGTNACDGGSSNDLFIHNYMDYSSDACQSEFTAGQKVRVIAAMTNIRTSFLESNGNMSLVPPTTAGIDFVASSSGGCVGTTISFTDLSSCIPNTFLDTTYWTGITFNWTFDNGTTTINSTLQNPVVTFTSAGIYDVTLQITNGSGTTSLTQQGFVVITSGAAAAACNATSSYGGTLEYGIHQVILNTINHSSGSTYTDNQSGLTVNGYGDFTCSESTTLQPNTSYDFSIEGLPYNPGNGEDFKVYIDYNNDGDFNDTGEEVLSWDNAPAPTGLLTQSFTTPASPVLNTLLRMRVISARDSETITPCMTTTRGQVHDFGVYITDDVASVTISVAPSNTIIYGTSTTFTATPVNGGSSPTYAWYVNGVLVSGVTGNTYNTSTLVDGDEVYCVMTSNMPGVIGSPATSNTIIMTVTGPPLSEFSGTPTALCAGSSVTFTDESLLAPTSWAWTFTGGTPSSSTSQNSTITYNTAGVYPVTLTASNGLGTGTTETKTGYITVYSTPAGICSSFTRTTTPAGGIGITNVSLSTINNTTANDDAVYQDFSCSNNATLDPNTTYNISVTVSSFNNQWVRVYIDYDQSNTFDAGELVFSPSNGQGVRSGTFTTPASPTMNQLLRMRVISDFVNTTPGSCTSPLQYGQVEDYGIIFNNACSAPTVDTDPSNSTICDGDNTSFTVAASGTATLTYQWQVSTNGGGIWADLSNGGIYSDVTTSILNLTGATTGEDGYQYQCVVTNGCGTATSSSATLTVNVTPSAPTVTVVDNCGSSTLTATGTNLLWSTGATTTSITVTTAGTYTVTQTVGGCTSSDGSGIANPTATPSAPTVTVVDNCGSSTLTATGTNLLWSTGATTTSITVTTLGTYTVTQTVGGCTSADGSGVANPTATPSAPTVTVVDNCGSSTLTATGTNLLWSTGATTTSITVTTPGTYTVTQTVGGCTSADGSGVANPTATPSAPTVTVVDNCGSSTLTATGTNLLWSTGATTTSITVTTPGTYTVTQTVGSCTSTDGSGIANPTAIPSAPTVTVVDNCGSSTLTATGTNLLWSTGATTTSITVTTPGTYTVTQTVGGCTSSDGSGVANPLSTPAIAEGTVTDATSCGASDGTIEVTGSGTGVVTWTVSGNSGTVTLPYTITGLAAGSYAITFDNGCPSNTLNSSIADPSAPSAPTVTVADNCGSSTLTATGTNLLWSTGATTSSITVTTPGTYTVTQTVGGCTSSDGSGVANPTAIPSAPTVTVVDNCGSSTLTATGTNLLWSTGATTTSITVTTPGTYTVTQTVGGCTSSDGSGVANPTAIPSAPTVTVVDNCGSSTLTATGTNLLWSTGATTTSITVTTPGTYTVTQTVGGCTSADGSGVANPTATPSAPTVTVVDNCGSSTLTATGTNLLWSTGATTTSITVTTPGTYTVTQTVGGCTSSDGSGVANPTAIPSAPTVTVVDNCGSSTLTATGTNLLWSTGATTTSITVTTPGTYTVTQTVGGCTSADGSGVANPTAIPSAPTVTVVDNCGSSTLTATGTNLLWSTGATTTSITVTTPGTYTVTQTVGGCTSTDGSGIANPTATPSAPTVTVVDNCGSSTLTATGTNLLWSTGATTTSITVTTPGTYTVTQTVGGCTSADGSGVANPTAIPSAPTVTVVDNCGSSTLTATGTNLLWSTGVTTTSITVTTPGTYTVTQTVGGCTSTDGSGIANPTATPSAPTVTVVDNCGSSTLTATGTNLLWSTGATTTSITVTTPGTYTVTQTVGGCTSADGSGVANPTATPSAPTVTVVDNCGSSTLTATGTNLLWSTGATTTSITVTTPGTYTVTQTVGGCTSSDGSGVANPTAIPSAPTVTVVDNCGSSTLTATGSNLNWSTTETTATIIVTTAGTYTVNQTVSGCTSADGSGVANPTAIPSAPTVTVVDNCGSSTLTATGTNLLWSTGATTTSITVTTPGTYTVTQTVGGCTSADGSGVANPTATPLAPTVTVVDNCGSSTLTATGTNLLWSTGVTTTSITVTTPGTYTVTQTVGSCTSTDGSGIANPTAIPSAPTVTVVDNCGSSTLTATGSNLNWSTTETTATIIVTTAGTYTVNQTVSGCTSADASGIANPIALPSTPVVTVVDDCGSSTLTTTGTNLNWSTTETTPSITVTVAGTYTVTQTSGGCTSLPGTGNASPYADPPTPVITANGPTTFCQGDNVALTSSATSGNTWSTSQTSQTIAASQAGDYFVTVVDGNGCSSASDTLTITVNPPPSVSFGQITDICENYAPITLVEGSPAGGTYSGAGVSGGDQFDPGVAGVGTHIITYEYTDGNGCTNSAVSQITVDDCLSLAEVDLSQVKLYPNPTSSNVTISAGDLIIEKVQVYDAAGRSVIVLDAVSGSTQLLDFSSYSEGMYTVEIVVNDKTVRKRLIKQ